MEKLILFLPVKHVLLVDILRARIFVCWSYYLASTTLVHSARHFISSAGSTQKGTRELHLLSSKSLEIDDGNLIKIVHNLVIRRR